MAAERQLLFGKDPFVKRRAVRSVREKLFPKGAGADLNFREWDAERDGWTEALDFLRTSGFLSEKRLAVLHNVDGVDAPDRFLEAVRDLPGWATLLLETSETNVRKNEFLQKLSEIAAPVPCHTPFERDLPGWVAGRAREAGFKIDGSAARVMTERLGRDLGTLDGAVETLALFIHPRREANAADVTRLFSAWADEDVFGIVDRLIEGDAGAAIAAAERVMEQGGKAPEIFAVLAGQFERFSRAQAAVRAGRSPLDAAQAAGVHPYYREKFAGQLRAMGAAKLAGWMRGLLEADESVKSGVLPDRLALERFLSTGTRP